MRYLSAISVAKCYWKLLPDRSVLPLGGSAAIAAVMILLLSVFAAAPAQAEVKCSCPSVAADGEGNSSCSAAESNSRCTIDYNLFAEREQRAADFLNGLDGNLSMQAIPDQGVDVLTRLNDDQLTKQVTLYLSIAAVDQTINQGDSISPASILSSVRFLIDGKRQEIERAFRVPADPLEAHQLITDEDNVVISRGCVEVKTDRLWMMFKAYWSPARALPRCGGRDLRP